MLVHVGVVVQGQFEGLVISQQFFTPFAYSSQLLYFKGAMSKYAWIPCA